MVNNPAVTTRLTFPEDRTTFVYGPPNTPIRTPPRTGLKIFADEACTVPADIQSLDGNTMPHSTIYTQDDSLLPEFLGPAGFTPQVWARVIGGTVTGYPLMAQYSEQIANLPVLLSGEGPPTEDLGAVGSFYIDKGTSTDPNVLDNPVVYGPRAAEGWPVEGTPLRGPQGVSGTQTTWTQVSPATRWRVLHNLQHQPALTLIDSAGEQFFADVSYPPNEPQVVIVDVGAPESGKALLK